MRIGGIKIAIDAHALGRGQAGYESYLRHLIDELPRAAPDIEFLVYRHLATGRARRLLLDLPMRLLRDRPDALHVQYAAPFPCFTPLVATIHDLSFVDVPQFYSPSERLLLRAAVGRTARLARRVITVSEFSKRRLMAVYGLPEERVIVAPNAAGPQFTPGPSPSSAVPYLLMVGDLTPRKNHIGAIRAFSGMSPDLRFKIAGRETPFAAHIRQESVACGVADRVDFLGYVDDAALPNLYRGAACCVYPSFYEGFGLPLLEAMACGTPVVTSRGSSLEEVAGGAALLAAAGDPQGIRQALEAALRDRAAWSAAGVCRASMFSWRESALCTARAFRESCRGTAAVHGRSSSAYGDVKL